MSTMEKRISVWRVISPASSNNINLLVVNDEKRTEIPITTAEIGCKGDIKQGGLA